jgi:hypothetical protein
MSVTAEILATWRDPAGPVRRLLANGPREDRALVILIGACILLYVARLPVLARQARLDPTVPLDASMGITLFSMLFVLPLLLYALAYLIHLAVRVLGRNGQAWGARTALFWALLAITPAALLQGLLEALLGPIGAVRAFGIVVFGFFLWFVGRGLTVAYARAEGVK